MKYLHLIWAALFRSKTRTFLTLLSVIAAFLLFGLLDSVRVAFNSGGSVAGADRLVVASRLSITQMLPYSLLPQIQSTPGVKKTAYAAWFGGIYQDPKNFFPNFSVSPDYFEMYPEYIIDPAQLKAWQSDRTGAIVGEALAKRGVDVADRGNLKVITTHDAGTPIISGQRPLLTIDVWEHAYYVDYRNRRAEHLAAVTEHLLNWEYAESNFIMTEEAREARV